MINAIAIDDEPVALEIIKTHALQVPFINLQAVFLSAVQALAYIKQNPVDLIFLDINMPDVSGLQFAGMIKQPSQIIFTTAHPEHALTGFELAATDYLLKPINFNRFLRACELAQSRLHTGRPGADVAESLFVKDGYNWLQIKLSDILYAQGQDNYVSIFEHDKRTLTRITLNELQGKLPPGQFIRIHKSYIAAIAKIERIEKQQVIINGTCIPLSKSFKNDLMNVFKG